MRLRETVQELIAVGVVPVFNENDAVSTRTTPIEDADQRIFWDNDSLAGLLSIELGADLLVLLSDVDGLFTGPPDDPESKLVSTFLSGMDDAITFGSKSRVGRGGIPAGMQLTYSFTPVKLKKKLLHMTAGFHCEHFADKHFYSIILSFLSSNYIGNLTFKKTYFLYVYLRH